MSGFVLLAGAFLAGVLAAITTNPWRKITLLALALILWGVFTWGFGTLLLFFALIPFGVGYVVASLGQGIVRRTRT